MLSSAVSTESIQTAAHPMPELTPSLSRRVLHSPSLSIAVLLMGLALSLAAPYLSLFGVTAAHMTPLALGLFLTSNAVFSIVISTLLGRWSDRHGDRRTVALLSLAAAATGYTLLAFAREYALLLLIGGLFLGTGAAAFPQLFAYARTRLLAAGAPDSAVTTLRSVFSFAWVVGPGLGALIQAHLDFRGLFLATALGYALAAIPLLRRPRPTPDVRAAAPSVQEAPQPQPRHSIGLIATSFTLYGTALSMGAIALPLYVTQTLHGTGGNVGFLVGLCALLEIPVMLAFAFLPRRTSTERLMVLAFALLGLYFLLCVLAGGLTLLAVAQAVRAAVIAVVAGLGITYFQDLMPGRLGAATTLFANTSNVGALLGGLLTGACAQVFGYRAVFVACVALALLAWALLVLARWRSAPPEARPTKADT